MSTANLKRQIEQNAQEIRRLHARIHETVGLREKSPALRQAWQEACREFHSRYDALAFPGGYEGAPARILAGDPATLETALCFIELRPYFFRSGYMYRQVLTKLKRAPLSAEQQVRLQSVLTALTAWRAVHPKPTRY